MAIDLAPATIGAEVRQNIATILATPKGSVPLDRAFGVAGIALDDPIGRARASITAEYVDAITTYEPRATIRSIDFTPDETTGRLKARVVFAVNGEVLSA